MLFKLLSATDLSRFPSQVISLTDRLSTVERIERLNVKVHTIGMTKNIISLKKFIDLILILKREKPALVQTWMYHADLLGGTAARLASLKTPVIWGLRHGNLEPGESKPSTRLILRCCARLSRFIPNQIICCSNSSRKIHQQLGYPERRMVVIPNGFDLESYKPDPEQRKKVRNKLKIQENTVVIGSVGRFHPQKDYQTFIRAAAITAKKHDARIKFILCGEQLIPENKTLIQWIDESGLPMENIELLGGISDMATFFPVFDIAALTSVSGEGFPNVLGEAMACEVPCVATDVGDSAWIIGDTGRTAPPSHPEAMAEAWSDLINAGPEQRKKLGRKARERIEKKFSLKNIVRQYEKIQYELTS